MRYRTKMANQGRANATPKSYYTGGAGGSTTRCSKVITREPLRSTGTIGTKNNVRKTFGPYGTVVKHGKRK
jgi:hypothetical protein